MLQLTSGLPFLQWSGPSKLSSTVVNAAFWTGVAIAPGTRTSPAVSVRSARPPLQPRRRRVLGLSVPVVANALPPCCRRPSSWETDAHAGGRPQKTLRATSKLRPAREQGQGPLVPFGVEPSQRQGDESPTG